MFFYQYYCEKNRQVIEVRHGAGTRLKTWGEVCCLAGADTGPTPAGTPVVRLLGGRPLLLKTAGLDKDDYGTKLEL